MAKQFSSGISGLVLGFVVIFCVVAFAVAAWAAATNLISPLWLIFGGSFFAIVAAFVAASQKSAK
jgi:hypothetical protein